jgi:hypothetical protein
LPFSRSLEFGSMRLPGHKQEICRKAHADGPARQLAIRSPIPEGVAPGKGVLGLFWRKRPLRK